MGTDYKGIDYSLGINNTNRDAETGIRYGVIPIHDVIQAWCDDSEPIYISACQHCGSELESDEIETCPDCGQATNDEDCIDFDPILFEYKNDGYECHQSFDDIDIFITKSPFFTYAQFCSPCAPGACHLESPLDHRKRENLCYCFGHDWFDNERAPYPVYEAKTGKRIWAIEKVNPFNGDTIHAA